MKYGIYVIRDQRTSFLTPTVDMNDATAMRNFEHAIQDKNSLFFTHVEDYSLYRIGTYDSDTGSIDPEMATLIVDGKTF